MQAAPTPVAWILHHCYSVITSYVTENNRMTVLHYWKLSSSMDIAVYMFVYGVVEVADVNHLNVWIRYFPPYISVAFLYMWDSTKILFFCAVCTVNNISTISVLWLITVQVKLWFDSGALQLVVTVASAAGLTPRNNGQPRNPYAKLFLLPDRRYALLC